MSLIRCQRCDSQISEEAENCPKCGYPISTMAKLKSKIQPIKQTKTIIGAQSVYAWLIILIGFVLIVAVPYESFGGIIGRAFGIALIIIGLVWGFIVGLPKWWSQ